MTHQNTISTILYVDRPEQCPAALQKLREMKRFSQVQLIVVDPRCEDEIRTLVDSFPNGEYLPAEKIEAAAAYNLGLEHAQGSFVHFMLSSAHCSEDFYAKALEAMEADEKLSLISAAPFFVPEQGECVPYAASPVCQLDQSDFDLSQSPGSIQLCLQAYVFRSSLLRQVRFDERLHEEAEIRLLMDVLSVCPRYRFFANVGYYYTVGKEDEIVANPIQHELWWYLDSLENFLIPMLEQARAQFDRIPLFMQYTAYYLVYAKYQCNINGQNKGLLHGADAEAMIRASFHVMALLDNQVLQERKIAGNCIADRGIRSFFLQGKAMYLNQQVHLYDDGRRFVTVLEQQGGTVDREYWNRIAILGGNSKESLRVRVMNYRDGVLTVDANVGFIDLVPREQFQVYAVSSVNGKETVIQPEDDPVYALIKCFGVTIQKKAPVRYQIPVAKQGRQTIQFYLRYQGKVYLQRLVFDTPYSRLETSNKYSYWMFRTGWMLSHTQQSLILRKVSKLFHFKRELLFCFEAYRVASQLGTEKESARTYLGLRLKYWLAWPRYSKRRVWITFDKLYKAGDNGEYFFQYCMKQKDGIDCYYLINENSPDTPRLKAQHPEHILFANSKQSLVMALYAEAVMATHAGIVPYLGFPKESYAYLKDLIHSENVCIQHGLSIQKIANFQNRRYANTKLYCLASPFERENVAHPIYGYSEEMLKMTGLARYDGLVNRDQKLILITPTWRKGLIPVKGVGQTNDYWEGFKSSAYYRIYNDLIHDPELIACAKRNGYRITYLLHPAMGGQLRDFKDSGYVDVIPATGDMSYEKILCESSLMVTDYSGVQFDFAYMRKPILYYHPDALPPHYDEGGMNYATQGFGPICTTHEQIVSALCDAMERGCTTQEEYIRRADDFFAYDDHNNCQRIYDAVHSWLEETK